MLICVCKPTIVGMGPNLEIGVLSQVGSEGGFGQRGGGLHG